MTTTWHMTLLPVHFTGTPEASAALVENLRKVFAAHCAGVLPQMVRDDDHARLAFLVGGGEEPLTEATVVSLYRAQKQYETDLREYYEKQALITEARAAAKRAGLPLRAIVGQQESNSPATTTTAPASIAVNLAVPPEAFKLNATLSREPVEKVAKVVRDPQGRIVGIQGEERPAT